MPPKHIQGAYSSNGTLTLCPPQYILSYLGTLLLYSLLCYVAVQPSAEQHKAKFHSIHRDGIATLPSDGAFLRINVNWDAVSKRKPRHWLSICGINDFNGDVAELFCTGLVVDLDVNKHLLTFNPVLFFRDGLSRNVAARSRDKSPKPGGIPSGSHQRTPEPVGAFDRGVEFIVLWIFIITSVLELIAISKSLGVV